MAAKRLRVYRGRHKTGRWLAVLIPLALLIGIGLLWRYDAASNARGRAVEVRLFGADGLPLAGIAASRLIDTAQLPASQWGLEGSETDAQGRLHFAGVSPGSYWLRAADNLYELRIPENAPASLSFSLSGEPDRYTLVLRLRDENGAPIARRAFTLIERGLETSPATSFSPVLQGESDWQGDLVLENVPAGGHLLWAEGYAEAPLILEPNEKKSVNAALALYPAQPEALAQPLTLYRGSGRPLAGETVTQVAYGLPGGREVALGQWQADAAGQLTLMLPAPQEITLRIGTRRFKLFADGQGKTLYP